MLYILFLSFILLFIHRVSSFLVWIEVITILETHKIGGLDMQQTTQIKDNSTRDFHVVDKVTANLAVEPEKLKEKLMRTLPEEATGHDVTEAIIKRSLEMMDEANPEWTYVASRAYLEQLYQEASLNRGYDAAFKYGDFYTLIRKLTEEGIYTDALLEKYTREEINYFGRKVN